MFIFTDCLIQPGDFLHTISFQKYHLTQLTNTPNSLPKKKVQLSASLNKNKRMRRNIMLLKVKSFLKGPTKRNQFALHSNERNTLQNKVTLVLLSTI